MSRTSHQAGMITNWRRRSVAIDRLCHSLPLVFSAPPGYCWDSSLQKNMPRPFFVLNPGNHSTMYNLVHFVSEVDFCQNVRIKGFTQFRVVSLLALQYFANHGGEISCLKQG